MRLVQQRTNRLTETSTRKKASECLSQRERKNSYKIGNKVDFYHFILSLSAKYLKINKQYIYKLFLNH